MQIRWKCVCFLAFSLKMCTFLWNKFSEMGLSPSKVFLVVAIYSAAKHSYQIRQVDRKSYFSYQQIFSSSWNFIAIIFPILNEENTDRNLCFICAADWAHWLLQSHGQAITSRNTDISSLLPLKHLTTFIARINFLYAFNSCCVRHVFYPLSTMPYFSNLNSCLIF